MLVGYSSSSEEDVEDGLPATKKAKTERDVTNSRLPLPGCLLSMFPDDEDAHTEDSTLHSGRIRSFKHERGNWATYVYLPYHAEEEFAERLEELLSAAAAHGVEMKQQQEFHLSLSQTVVLKHHWIQPFTQSLRKSLSRWERFVCTAGRLKVYCNEERTRTFLGMESSTGHTELLDLVQVVDRTMTEFCLQTFYENPSFHISLAWCVGDKSVQMKECLRKLQSLSDEHEEGAFLLRLDCEEVRCRTGNKTFRFPLECRHAT
ncbi:U6 snRNA phosphodiesterase 1 [Gouania willdenowi]|uniref:U6 snRNA phosphodiesterase n=1 Tax=Gouania willdenowi TaxID=441366 RepID=A0A8C5FYJ9_GOUWI|nr:U6 snRNA phosphodiesterase [Gouania willdenowi]